LPRHQHRQVIAALIRTFFAQPDGPSARLQLRSVVDQFVSIAPGVAARFAGGRRPARLHRVPAIALSKMRSNTRSGGSTGS